jgi:CheY-like chemotaxis protein
MEASAPKRLATRILLATADPVLRDTRKAVIENFGFDVKVSTTIQNALDLINSERFEILVLGHTLSSQECCKLARAFRQRRASGRVIEIARYEGAQPLNNPDAVVVGMDGPAALRKTIEAQLLLVKD